MSRNRILRYLKPVGSCSCEVADDDFRALISSGRLVAERKLRLGRHVLECQPCQSLLAALVMIAGLRRVLRSGMGDISFHKGSAPPGRPQA